MMTCLRGENHALQERRIFMNVAESLEKLRIMARADEELRQRLLETKESRDPLKAFCEISTQAGCPLAPMELVVFGEESYASIRRSTNGGGENSPLLEWEDDYYELLLAELRSDGGK